MFFPRCVRECSRSCVRKWGAQRPLAGNPYFTVFRGFLERSSYCKSPDKYAVSSRGNTLTMRHLPTSISDCRLWTRTLASGESEVRSCRGQTCPELRGEWVFQVYGLEMAMQSPKTTDLEKWQNLFVLARPSSFLCFFGGAPGFHQNRFFMDNFLLKPL